jgi:hypothetical protein
MNEKIKRKWCSALRGGNWVQMSGDYKNREEASRERCALGVLAEVIDPGFQFVGNKLYGCLDIRNQSTISSMNDHENRSFSEIADWIEEHL